MSNIKHSKNRFKLITFPVERTQKQLEIKKEQTAEELLQQFTEVYLIHDKADRLNKLIQVKTYMNKSYPI